MYSRVVRGGSWEMDDVQCRSAARLASSVKWQQSDPQRPQSPWWFSDAPATGIGFRLLRPLEVPKTLAAKNEFWKPDHDGITTAALARAKAKSLGTLGKVNEKLVEEMEKVLDE